MTRNKSHSFKPGTKVMTREKLYLRAATGKYAGIPVLTRIKTGVEVPAGTKGIMEKARRVNNKTLKTRTHSVITFEGGMEAFLPCTPGKFLDIKI